MDPKIVLAKTEKGIDEIRTRPNRLPQQRRNVLIFVDGRFSVGELVARFSNVGDLMPTLQSLLDEGYIAPTGTGRGSAGAPRAPSVEAPASPSGPTMRPSASAGVSGSSTGQPAAPAAPARSPVPNPPSAQSPRADVNFAVPSHQQAEFRQEVRGLSRSLYDAIGPDADNVTSKLEAAKDRESFTQAVASCARMVEGLGGRRKAEAFRQRAQSILDRFLSG